MREMILAEDAEGRKKALAKLLPLQRQDFIGIFQALAGRPATIRFLDPPLHEFLPHDEAGQQEMAAAMNLPDREDQGHGGVAARVQPDAGPSRLPAGHHLPGDHGHAGPGGHRGGLCGQGLQARRS